MSATKLIDGRFFDTIRYMGDIYPIWKMCYVFRDREMSRNTDHIKEELKTKGFDGVELENQIIMESSKGKDYGLMRDELIGAYTHKYYEELRKDGDSVDVNKVRQKNPTVVNEAHEALSNCIDLKFFSEKSNKIYLNASGRMLVSEPLWQNPFSRNKEKKWNIYLIIEYIKAIGPIWGVTVSIVLIIFSYCLGTLNQ